MSPARMYSTHLLTAASNSACVKFESIGDRRRRRRCRCRPAAGRRSGVAASSTSSIDAPAGVVVGRCAGRRRTRRAGPCATTTIGLVARCRTRPCGRRTRTTGRAGSRSSVRRVRQVLDVADRVVAGVADRAADERRQLRQLGRRESLARARAALRADRRPSNSLRVAAVE